MESSGGSAQPRVLLVEDSRYFASGLLGALAAGAAIEHVTTLAAAHAALAARDYALALLDVRLPDGSGLDLAQALAARAHAPSMVLMTAYGGAAVSIPAGVVGARYLDKVMPDHERFPDLVAAVRRCIDDADARCSDTEAWKTASARDLAAGRGLTPRQLDALEEIAHGATTREEIALGMGIGVSGLKAHLDVLFDKLQSVTRERSFLKIQNWILEHALYLAVTRRR